MPKVTFLPAGKSVEVTQGASVSDAALVADLSISLPCGGKGTCGKCLVQVVEGRVDSKPSTQITGEERAAGYVHACLSTVLADVTILIPELSAAIRGVHLDDGIDPTAGGEDGITDLSPLTRQVRVRVPEPAEGDGLSDLDRIDRTLKPLLGASRVQYPLPFIRRLAEALRGSDGDVTVDIAEGSAHARAVDVRSGHGPGGGLGIAVDLGTTTVSVQLVSLEENKILSTRNGYNDQILCGLDVISRINYASKPGRLLDLRSKALDSVNRLIREACEGEGFSPESITSCALSGNTVMTHLLLGLPPEFIRLHPYTPTVLDVPLFTASELGIDIHENALVRLSPCVGSYVGGDITAGVLVTDLAKGREDVSLLMDIGTNGEIVVGSSDFLMTCACSAGPAFEGGGIDCGMRATTGAIDRITIDPGTGRAQYTVIGGGKPAGICGSGLIDLVAGLFLTGFLDSSGRLDRSGRCPAVIANGRRASYTVAEEGETMDGKPIRVSETDIDNLMRAKAAIYSAASLMLGQLGLSFGDLSSFSVAGGFGKYLDLRHAITIGLLPDIPFEKFRYIGNASLAGTRLALLSKRHRDRQDELASRMTYIDLSTFPGYMDGYTAALFLPHTDLHLFPSVMKGKAQVSRKGPD
jgi:uncharacterized 2Fe-2S/4Fe-4S cluster protein (DUF4445 family)